jgi:hypothetical protein
VNYIDQESPNEPHPFKAWWVYERHGDLGELVHADTRGKAILNSSIYHDSGYDFIVFGAKRKPEFDGIQPTDKMYLEKGYYPVECTKCYKELNMEDVEDGLAFFDEKEQVWCKNCLTVKTFGE